jgi:catechol 2,3-dioxygenase-like lactoylglutathione lyase family enzyme
MTGTVDELADPFLLVADGVPPWLQRIGFGHSKMYWDRVIEDLEVEWPRGGRSLYFRDPAGNSVELVTPGPWGLPGGW